MRALTFLVTLAILFISSFVNADDMRPASLNITIESDNIFSVIWKLPAANGKALKLDVLFDPQVSTLAPRRLFDMKNTLIQQWKIKRKNGVEGLEIKIIGLENTSRDVLLHLVNQQGETISTQVLNSTKTQYQVSNKLAPQNTFLVYLMLGIEHILIGLDHLLFIACLIYISCTRTKLLLTITGFTLAHSVTLILAATNIFTVPIPPVEAAIALSIVFLAGEIAKNDKTSLSMRYPVIVASSFGLLHGFGFASVLADIGLPTDEKILALLSFNVGVELGQLLFVGFLFFIAFNIQKLFKRLTLDSIRHFVSYFSGILAMFWLFTRLATL